MTDLHRLFTQDQVEPKSNKALEILSRTSPNCEGLLVLSADEVEEIKGEVEHLLRYKEVTQGLIGDLKELRVRLEELLVDLEPNK